VSPTHGIGPLENLGRRRSLEIVVITLTAVAISGCGNSRSPSPAAAPTPSSSPACDRVFLGTRQGNAGPSYATIDEPKNVECPPWCASGHVSSRLGSDEQRYRPVGRATSKACAARAPAA
jgi:hypothetical protein